MLITLRKAKKIQASIQTAIAAEDAKLTPRIVISTLKPTSEVEGIILKARDTLRTQFDHLTRLESIVFDIRRKVGQSNHTSGISDLVTEQASLKSREKRLARLIAGTTETPELVSVMTEFAATKEAYERITDSYSLTSREFRASAVDAELLTGMRVAHNALVRRIADIQDTLEDLNKKQTIEISDEDMAYLQAALII